MPSHAVVGEDAPAESALQVTDVPAPDGRAPRPKRSWWWSVPLAASLLVFIEGLTFRKFLAPQEASTFNFPLHVLVGRLWRDGTVPVWNQWSFSGSPLLATGQAGVFYPVNFLFVLLPPVVANNFAVIAGFALCGTGAFLLGRHLTGDPAAGAVTGVAFAFSAFFFAHLPHQAVLDSATWLPWIFYGFERLREEVTPRRVAVAGGAVALAFLGGHSQMAAISLMALALYAGLLFLFDTGRGRPRRASTALAAAVAVVVGAGLSAPQWLPSIRVLGATDRADVPFQLATSYSLPPSHLPLLGFPYLFGAGAASAPFTAGYRGDWNLTELSGYPGLAAFVLAMVGVVAFRRRRHVLVLLTMAVLAVMAAMGASTPLGRRIYALPIYGQFRSWGRFIIVFELVVAVLAGYGAAALRRSPTEQRSHAPARGPDPPEPVRGKVLAATAVVTATVLTAFAFIVDAIGPVSEHLPEHGPHVLARVLPTAASIVAAGLVVLAVWKRRRATLVVGVLCAVVLADVVFSFGWELAWRSPIVRTPEEAAQDVEVSSSSGWGEITDAGGGLDRVLFGGAKLGATDGYPQVNAARHLPSVNGFDPLAPADYLDAASGMDYGGGVKAPRKFWQAGSHLLDLLRVTTVLTSAEPLQPRPYPDDQLTGGRTVADDKLVRFEHTPTLPDAYVVAATRQADRASTLRAIAGEAAFDPAGEALVGSGGCEGCPGPRSRGQAGTATRRSSDSSIAVDVDVTTGQRAFLVVSEAWFPGWEATVDGHSAAVVRADGMLLGVAVPPGRHDVHLVYRAPGLRLGVGLAVLTALALVGWAVVDRRRSRSTTARPD